MPRKPPNFEGTVADKGLDKLMQPRGTVTPLLHAILGRTDLQR